MAFQFFGNLYLYIIYRSLGDLEFIPQIWIPMTHPSTFPRPICQPLENMAAMSFQRCFTRASCDTKKARGPLQRYDLEVGYVKMAKEWHSFTMSLKNIPRYIHNMCIYVYTDIYIYIHTYSSRLNLWRIYFNMKKVDEWCWVKMYGAPATWSNTCFLSNQMPELHSSNACDAHTKWTYTLDN